jgi:hypothetical protein
MTQSSRTRSTRTTQAIARARHILSRVDQLDTDGNWDLENTRNRELAVLQLEIDLLESPYLTLPGLQYVEELIIWSEQWIDDAETAEAEEEER